MLLHKLGEHIHETHQQIHEHVHQQLQGDELHAHFELDIVLRSPIAVLESYHYKLEHYHKQAHDFLHTLTLEQKAEFLGIGRAFTLAHKELMLLLKTRLRDPVFFRHQIEEIKKIFTWLHDQHPSPVDPHSHEPIKTGTYGPHSGIPVPDWAQLVLPESIKSGKVSIKGNLGGLLLNLGASIDLNLPVHLLHEKPSLSLTTRHSSILTGNVSVGATAGIEGGVIQVDPSHVEGPYVTFAVDIAPKDIGAGVSINYALEYPPRIVSATVSGLIGFEVGIGLNTTATVIIPIFGN
jgi:hypothetical protein